jgi:hypothetical protein
MLAPQTFTDPMGPAIPLAQFCSLVLLERIRVTFTPCSDRRHFICFKRPIHQKDVVSDEALRSSKAEYL